MLHASFVVISLALAVLYGTLSVWTASANRRFGRRATMLVAALIPFLPLRAYDPFIFYSIQCIVTIAGCRLWMFGFGTDNVKSTGLRFSLSGFLVACVFLSAFLAVLARVELPSVSVWLNLVLGSTAFGIATLLGAVGLKQPWRLSFMGAVMIVSLVIALPIACTDSLLLHFPYYQFSDSFAAMLGYSYPVPKRQLAWWLIFVGLSTILYSLFSAFATRNSDRTTVRLCSRLLMIVVGGLALGIPTWVYLHVPGFPPAQQERQLSVNGYDLIQHAVDEVGISATSLRFDVASIDELSSYLAGNEVALGQIHDALKTPTSLPDVPNARGSANQSLTTVRRSLTPFNAELELLYRTGEYQELVRLSLDIINFGHELGVDASTMKVLMGRSFQYVAFSYLCEIRSSLTSDVRRRLQKSLAKADRRYEDYASVYSRAQREMVERWGWRNPLSRALPQPQEVKEQLEEFEFWPGHQTVNRMLLIDCRIREFHDRHGRYPKTLHELSELGELLVDPMSRVGEQLHYRASGDDFVIYSVGADGDDDDGKPIGFGAYDEKDGDYVLGRALFPL